MKWGLWSTTAASNSATPPDGWPEGQAPSTVNDCAREMMAAIKTGILDLAQGYIDIGQSPTFVTATTFTTPNNDLSYMPVGGRLRFNVGSSTLYGTIISASYSTNTGITVTLDSGSLTASLSSMAIGVNPGGVKTHFDGAVTISTSAAAAYGLTLTNTNTLNGIKLHCSAGEKVMRVSNASAMEWVNSANTVVIMTLTDAGALTCVGNITAFSDERLKKNWRHLPMDFIERMADVKVGTFDMEGHPDRMVGVGAQHMLRVLPEAVMADQNGVLSVAYGNAALATCVQLCREVMYLRERVSTLEAKVNK